MVENFYALLELPLDPPVLDWARVQAQIKVKQREWGALKNHPSKGRQAQQWLEMIAEIEKALSNPDTLRLQAAEAKTLKVKEEQQKFKALERSLHGISLKGYVTEDELGKLAKLFPAIPPAEIRKRVRVKVRPTEIQPKGKTQPPLEKSMADQIRQALEIIGKTTLYDFLGVSERTSLKELLVKTKEKDRENKGITKKTAAVSAEGQLVGHCLNIFRTEDQRESYHATLRKENLLELSKKIEELGLVSGRIYSANYDDLLKLAIRLGQAKNEAEEYIRDYATKRKWSVEVPSELTVDKLRQCGHCGAFSDKQIAVCASCGNPLDVSCPKCGKKGDSQDRACTGCGFVLGDMPLAMESIKHGKLAWSRNDAGAAEESFRKAALYWPNHHEIADGLAQIAKRKTDVQMVVAALRTAMADRRFQEAKRQLDALKLLDSKQAELVSEKTVLRQIEAAEQYLRKARAAIDKEMALDAFMQAQAECADSVEALQGIAQSPPSAPQNLTATPSQKAVSLRWTVTPARGKLTYRVLRKFSSQPVHVADGELLAETSQSVFDDTSLLPGHICYYGVFALRGGVVSVQAAVCGPIMILGDVEKLEVIPGDGCMNLRWQAPAKTLGVEVWRKENSLPRRAGDGVKVSGVRSDGIVDSGLSNNTSYGYLIITLFRDTQGKTVLSPGVTRLGTPAELPRAVTDLSCRKVGGTLQLRWTPPKLGRVELFFSLQILPEQTGKLVSVAELALLGKAVPVQGAGNATWSLPHQGMAWFVPVTLYGDAAILGRPITYTSLDGVEQLKGQVLSGNIFMEWKWPTGARTARVSWRFDKYPENADDATAVYKDVAREQYDKDSAFILRQPEVRDHFFSVFISSTNPGGTLYSSSATRLVSFSRASEIYYRIVAKGWFGKKTALQLELFTNGENVTLPPVVLVKKRGSLPVSRQDGEAVLVEVGQPSLGKEPLILKIAREHHATGTYAKLFLKRDADASEVRLMAPFKEKLQL